MMFPMLATLANEPSSNRSILAWPALIRVTRNSIAMLSRLGKAHPPVLDTPMACVAHTFIPKVGVLEA